MSVACALNSLSGCHFWCAKTLVDSRGFTCLSNKIRLLYAENMKMFFRNFPQLLVSQRWVRIVWENARKQMETKYRKMETYAFIAVLATATKATWNGIEVPFERIFSAPPADVLQNEMLGRNCCSQDLPKARKSFRYCLPAFMSLSFARIIVCCCRWCLLPFFSTFEWVLLISLIWQIPHSSQS